LNNKLKLIILIILINIVELTYQKHLTYIRKKTKKKVINLKAKKMNNNTYV